VANGWGTIHTIPDKAPPLKATEEGGTNPKRTNPRSNSRLHFFHPTMGAGRQDFITYLTILPPLLNPGCSQQQISITGIGALRSGSLGTWYDGTWP
jgi:hypothetical protein